MFWIGIAMIAWDFMGHFCCLLARTTGNGGATLWNNYSKFIWPSMENSIEYEMFWSVWFAVALLFIIVGRGTENKL